jgi:hypothetical protein
MLCTFGHDHTKHPVIAATHNASRPRGPRPFHCAGCHESHKLTKRERNWLVYATAAAALAAGHPDACRFCFAPAEQRGDATL